MTLKKIPSRAHPKQKKAERTNDRPSDARRRRRRRRDSGAFNFDRNVILRSISRSIVTFYCYNSYLQLNR